EEEAGGRGGGGSTSPKGQDSPSSVDLRPGASKLLQAAAPLAKRVYEKCQEIADVERKCTLLLAFFRRYPYFRTPCCNAAMCFKCKTAEWHPGQTCEQRMRDGLGITKRG
ncbi:unnamed protein product, partial [Amoebophrya sp. A120]